MGEHKMILPSAAEEAIKLARELLDMRDHDEARIRIADALASDCERKLANYDRLMAFAIRIRMMGGDSEEEAREWVHIVLLGEPSR